MDERRSDEDQPGQAANPDAGGTVAGGNPTGGDTTTEEQLEADNAVEEDMLATLDPDNRPV
jgi:hypothetical protein